MSSVYFVDRKNGDLIDCSFSVKSYDGDNSKPSVWNTQTGDEVTLMFSVKPEIGRIVSDLEFTDSTFRINRMSNFKDGYDYTAFIPMEVTKRRSMLHFREWEPTHLTHGGIDIFLRATSGLWEDLLLWILLNQVPKWATEQSD